MSDGKTCPRCAESVKAAAKVCKHCGYDFTMATAPGVSGPKKRSKLAMGCGVIALIVVGLFILGMIFGPSDKTTTSSNLSAEAEPQALAVTARELANAYEANEQAAQTKYGAQPLEVSGTISSIELDITNSPMVSLETGQMFREVTLHFDKSFAEKTGALRKGEHFTGTCQNVSEVLSAPQLNDCAF